MVVQCPNCGHSGNLSPDMESGPHKIRCRRCGITFATESPVIDQKGLPDATTEVGIAPLLEPEEEAMEIPDDGVGNLKIEISREDEPSAEIEPSINLRSDPWFYGFLDAWGKLYLYAAGFLSGVVSLGLIVVAIGAMPTDRTLPIQYLIAVLIFIVPVVIGLLTCAAIIFLIVDQARNIRRLNRYAERMESILRSESGRRR